MPFFYLAGVGSRAFAESVKSLLGALAKERKAREAAQSYQLREPSAVYGVHFGVKNDDIRVAPTIGTFMMNNQ